MPSGSLVHIFDAVARDQRVLRATDTELEVEYITESDCESDDEFRSRRRRGGRGGGGGGLANREYVIHLFGTTAEGSSVRLEVTGFKPFFFLELPGCRTPTDESRMKREVQMLLEKEFRKLGGNPSDITYEICSYQKLYGYTGGKSFPFLKLTVPSLGAFRNLQKVFLDENAKARTKFKVYESNIDPLLRFFHIQDIQPCGWVSFKGEELDSPGCYRVEWSDMKPAAPPAGLVSAPFNHCFWDIECYSHDGEFPVAKQGYRRVAKRLVAEASTGDEMVELLKAAFRGENTILPPLLKPSLRPTDKEVNRILSAKGRKEYFDQWIKTRSGLTTFKDREEALGGLIKTLDSWFGEVAPIAGDPIIQIGSTAVRGGAAGAVKRHIFVLGSCDPVEGATVHSVESEEELLRKWFEWLETENFDILSGYNIFGFDEHYIWDRLCELGMEQDEVVQRLGRLFDEGGQVKLEEKMLSSSALGDNRLQMWVTQGRLRIDLYGHIKRKTQMPSYKLDAVAAAFLSGKLSGCVPASNRGGRWLLKTKQKGDARVGRYVQLLDELGEDLTEKAPIVEITGDGLVIESEEDLSLVAGEAVKWAVVKDDVPPQELFKLHRGSSADRARIASYCIQDCDLVYELYKKLDVFNEAMSMANVCSVPVGYIFTRGQGIKIESLIFKDCRARGQLIEVLARPGGQEEDSYEGAFVWTPNPGFYVESPVGVCDFASLYPSTIISENISHDMLVWVKDYDLAGNLVGLRFGSDEDELNAPPGTRWTDIEFDIKKPAPGDMRKNPEKVKAGTRICRFGQPAENRKGSLPEIVAKLLAARKAKRAEIAKTDDPFKKALLDAEQNAYKITANSLYGQLGSRTFKIRLQHLAASVTAYGRKQINFSIEAIKKFYGPDAGRADCAAEIVYGDTDSIFVAFNPRGPDGERLHGREAVVKTIELTTEAGRFITGALKAPHDFEYDKTMYPFIIFSKKRYVGNLYEDNPDEFKETSMGIVLKRRDNAPLLKMAYGAAIDCLLNRRDVPAAVEQVKETVRQLINGKMKLSQLTITKSLRAEYAGTPPAHKILADRIAARDPGNAPGSGERLGYVYFKAPVGQEASKLQGDRVETPAYMVEKGLEPDAEYYIEHQLRKPLEQLFGLVLERMPGFTPPRSWAEDEEKRITQREILAGELLFKEGLAATRSAATRAFLSMIPGATTGEATTRKSPRRAVAGAPKVPLPVPEGVVKRQSSLDAFLKDSACFSDGILAKEMAKAKRKSKK
jgi:DNA polymerase elongation subunit (family B)